MFADASKTRLAYIEEVTENTTPSSPAFQVMRFTGESLNYNKQTVVSNEINATRNVTDLIDVGYDVAGDINFELSYGTLDALLESLMQSGWASDVIENGVTPTYFTFEKTFEQGATDSYFRFTGCQVNSMSLNIQARQVITGTLNIMGRGHTTATAIIASATYTAANSNAVMSASADVGSLALTGITGTPRLMSITLNITNNLRGQPEVGAKPLAGIGAGRFVVTGSLEAYFENLNMYNAFKDHTSVEVEVTLGSVADEKYTLHIPVIKLSNGVITAGGNDQDVMATFDFQGILDSGIGATMELTRAVA